MRILPFYAILILVVVSSCKDTQNNYTSLNGDWQFSQLGDSLRGSALVPGTIQSDLLRLGEIPDPFIGSNEDSIQWVSSQDWLYQRSFALSDVQFNKKNHILVFDGLDTYADIYLNDSLILSANNAFRKWEVHVEGILKKDNLIKIKFKSVDSIEIQKASKLSYILPESPRVFSRKAQFQYGWDWGPIIKTIGIWRDVKLISYEEALLKEVFFQTKEITDSLATIDVLLEIESSKRQSLDVLIYNKTVGEEIKVSIDIAPEQTEYSIPITVKEPKLWWAHNLGDPFLYEYQIELMHSGKKIIDERGGKFGIRSIELITEKDSIGEVFYFKLNGEPIYAKGANYIPQNILYTEVQPNDYKNLIHDVVDSNMNMLRVWGGGIYENDIFYELCDEYGILVWQDFMFACAMYPGDPDFLENVKREAIDNVKRLRSHPSLALWCGNNENSEGWHRWGWKEGKTEDQQQQIWDGYYALFNHILPRVVDSLNPAVSYWETSPKHGRGDLRYQFEGDAHDWFVWHDGYPFEHFEEQIPRFMSEFGFQSFPSYEAIRYFTTLDSIDLNHHSFKTHQKHNRGFSLIQEYMERDFPVPNKDEDYVYVSQLLQAYGIIKGIHAHRRAKPYNMGTLYWQLNDCWPVVSWSGIDGLGYWKALQYKVKKAFENVLISTSTSNNSVFISLINDSLMPIEDTLSIVVKDFRGTILENKKELVRIGKNSNSIVASYPLSESLKMNNTFLQIDFGSIEHIHFFTNPKNLILEAGNIRIEKYKVDDGFLIELYSEILQKDVCLKIDKKGNFSDNFFDLLPKTVKKIHFLTKSDSIDVKIISLNKFSVQ